MSDQIFSVLVIDDEPDVLESVRLGLRSTNWRVLTAATPADGLAKARTLLPNVILCDASMPRMSGPEVIQLLKNDPATAHIPVVLMTGIAEAYMFESVPWTGFLAKPFAPDELRDAVSSAAVKWNA
jgi:CheY-like chemotaxis protein